MGTTTEFNIKKIRHEFPMLQQLLHGKPFIYLDSAATTQKPRAVIEAMRRFYEEQYGTVHRSVYDFASQATTRYSAVRQKVKEFLGAAFVEEIIFTKGTTESINLVASSFGRAFLQPGDEVLITAMEHHSNIVPWQLVCEEKKAKLKVIPFNDNGELMMDSLENLLNEKVKIVAITHISNALGTVNPIKEIIRKSHEKNIPVLVDGAQAVPHMKVDVQDLDCDFYCFSGHKVYAPMGVGVLYGKEKWLEELPPYQGGGEMIKNVTFEKTTYNELPFKFEAGTPNVGDGLGLETALKYLSVLGLENIFKYEDKLLAYANKKLSEIEGLRFIGNAKEKKGVISFLIGNIHPSDIGVLLDKMGIAVRTGHHCAQPVMDFFGIHGTLRTSFALYNTKEEVDILIEGIKKAVQMLG